MDYLPEHEMARALKEWLASLPQKDKKRETLIAIKNLKRIANYLNK
jgi:hypothetical protein